MIDYFLKSETAERVLEEHRLKPEGLPAADSWKYIHAKAIKDKKVFRQLKKIIKNVYTYERRKTFRQLKKDYERFKTEKVLKVA